MKTHNLTQISLWNDPINRRIYGFSFRNFEDEDGIQDMIFPYPLDRFSISSTPWTRKRVKKGKKSIDSRIVVSRQFDFTQKSKGKFRFTKNIEFIEKRVVSVGSNSPSQSTAEITCRLIETVRLSHIHLIGDGRLMFVHVDCSEKTRRLMHPFDLHPTIGI